MSVPVQRCPLRLTRVQSLRVHEHHPQHELVLAHETIPVAVERAVPARKPTYRSAYTMVRPDATLVGLSGAPQTSYGARRMAAEAIAGPAIIWPGQRGCPRSLCQVIVAPCSCMQLHPRSLLRGRCRSLRLRGLHVQARQLRVIGCVAERLAERTHNSSTECSLSVSSPKMRRAHSKKRSFVSPVDKATRPRQRNESTEGHGNSETQLRAQRRADCSSGHCTHCTEALRRRVASTL